jgi:hypothetical protein
VDLIGSTAPEPPEPRAGHQHVPDGSAQLPAVRFRTSVHGFFDEENPSFGCESGE